MTSSSNTHDAHMHDDISRTLLLEPEKHQEQPEEHQQTTPFFIVDVKQWKGTGNDCPNRDNRADVLASRKRGFKSRTQAYLGISQASRGDVVTYEKLKDQILDACEGCAKLRPKHVPMFGSSLPAKDETWNQIQNDHGLTIQGIHASKRILMTLASCMDIEYAPCLIDVTCISIRAGLSEGETYAFVRALIIQSSSLTTNKWQSTPSNFFIPTNFSTCHVFHKTFLTVARKFLGSYFVNQHVREIEALLDRFFVPILLPRDVLRLMDFVMLDGAKALVRFGVAVLGTFKSAMAFSVRKIEDTQDMIDLLASSLRQPSKVSTGCVRRQRRREVVTPTFLCVGGCTESNSATLRTTFHIVLTAAYSLYISRTDLNIYESNVWATMPPPASPEMYTLPHIPKHVFSDSHVISSFDDLEFLIERLPSLQRFQSGRMKKTFAYGQHTMKKDKVLKELYSASSGAGQDACVLLLRAQVPENNVTQGMSMVTTATTMLPPKFCTIGVFFSGPIGECVDASGIILFRFFDGEEAGVWRYQAPSQTQRSGGGGGSPLEFQATHKHLWVGAITTSKFMESTGEECVNNVEPPTPSSSSSPSPVPQPGVVERLVGPSLYLNDELTTAHTGYSVTYKNDPLCIDDKTCQKNLDIKFNHCYFDIVDVELYSFPTV